MLYSLLSCPCQPTPKSTQPSLPSSLSNPLKNTNNLRLPPHMTSFLPSLPPTLIPPKRNTSTLKKKLKNSSLTRPYPSGTIKSSPLSPKVTLLHLEQTDAKWKSFIYSLPKGLMSFVFHSSVDCLPSLAVLKRMHKRTSVSFPLCGNHQTLHHILNFCSVSLQQGRFTWRHNSVPNHLYKSLISAFFSTTPAPTIFADLPDCPLPGASTIPLMSLPLFALTWF